MDGTLTSAFLPLGVALALGLLVGLQRERESPTVAGVRTSAITALLGASTALATVVMKPDGSRARV